jgi:hypothetical protein
MAANLVRKIHYVKMRTPASDRRNNYPEKTGGANIAGGPADAGGP